MSDHAVRLRVLAEHGPLSGRQRRLVLGAADIIERERALADELYEALDQGTTVEREAAKARYREARGR